MIAISSVSREIMDIVVGHPSCSKGMLKDRDSLELAIAIKLERIENADHYSRVPMD
jgi:hypothetical protein